MIMNPSWREKAQQQTTRMHSSVRVCAIMRVEEGAELRIAIKDLLCKPSEALSIAQMCLSVMCLMDWTDKSDRILLRQLLAAVKTDKKLASGAYMRELLVGVPEALDTLYKSAERLEGYLPHEEDEEGRRGPVNAPQLMENIRGV